MTDFKLNDSLNKNKIFLVNRSEIEERLDPNFYTDLYRENEVKINNSPFMTKSLYEITTKISDGTHFTPSYQSNGIKFISVKDVRKSSLDLNHPVYISIEEADKLDKRCKPQKNDILLTKIGATYGYAAVVDSDERFQIFVSLALIRPNYKLVNPHYLEICLNSEFAYLQFQRNLKGAGVPDLHLEEIRKLKLPIPALDIQKEIVKKYDSGLKESRNKQSQSQSLLKSIDSYLLDELGIELPKKDDSLKARIITTKFSEICGGRLDCEIFQKEFKDCFLALENGRYKTTLLKTVLTFLESGSRPNGGANSINDGILSFGGEHVNAQFEVGYGTPKYISEEYHKKIIQTETVLYDILLVKDGATTGKIGIIENEKCVKQNINEHVFLLRSNSEKIDQHYLCYYLHSAIGQLEIKHEITGATVTGISKTSVKNLQIPLPPLSKQVEIAEQIKQIRQQAKQLEIESEQILTNAKKEIEKMILGE